MKKWLLGVVASLAAVVLLLAILMAGLITTQSGTRWLLTTVLQQSGQPVALKNINGSLWSGLSVEQIEFENCAVELAVKNLRLDWQPGRLLQRALTIDALLADEVNVTPKADCEPVQEEPFTLPLEIRLPITIDLARLFVQQINLHSEAGTQSIQNAALQASVSPDQLQLQLKSLDYKTLSLRAQTTVQLQAPYPLQANANWQYVVDTQKFVGEATLQGDSGQLALNHQLQSPYQIQTQVSVSDPLSEPSFESRSTWQQIKIVLDETQSIVLREGTLIADGNPARIDYDLNTQLDTAHAENIHVKAQGVFADNTVTLAPAGVQHANATLQANGKLSFADQLAVTLNINAAHFNPGLWLADYPGDLAADIDLDYQQQQNTHRLNLQIHTLDGVLRGYPLQGAGHISSDLQQTKLDNVSLSIGDNHLRANGAIGDSIDIEASLNATSIDQLLAQAAGDMSGEFTLSGTVKQPRLNARLQSKKLQFADQFLSQQLVLDAAVEGLEKPDINTRLQVDTLQVAGQRLNNSKLSLRGSEDKHQLQLSTDSSHGSLQLQAEGTLQREQLRWNGQLNELKISKTSVGDWQTPGPVSIIASPTQQTVDPLCLQQQQQKLCATYQNAPDQPQRLRVDLQRFDFKLLEPFIRQYASISGWLNGDIDLRADADGIWRGKARLSTDALKVVASENTGLDETITFDQLQMEALLDQTSQLQAKFESNRGVGNIDVIIDALQQPDIAEIKQGSVRLNIPELTFINPYLQGAVIKKGQVDVDIQLSGPLKKPNVSGQANLEQLGFYLPTLGSEIDNGSIAIKSTQDARLQIDGQLFAKDAQLDVNGKLSLQQQDFLSYQFHIKGEKFPLLDTVDYVADVSPDLKLVGNAKQLQVNGDVGIPKLHIILKELPKGVDSVSTDQVIVTPDGEEIEQDAFVVVGDVNVSIGDEASFTGYGLYTELGGGLKVSLREKKPPAGFGVVTLNNGEYRALGQALEIDKGEILFSGPLDNPSLDIRIKRSIDTVTVTLSLTGRADDPQSRLSSDPAMSEANKLSYLITGRPVDDLQGGEGPDLTSAAFALGLNKSSSVVQEIGTKFGLDTLSVQAGDDGVQSTSLLLGKHLSPRLFISYAKDLFSPLGAIQLNYRLTDHISIEAESGTTQTVDLIYSIATD